MQAVRSNQEWVLTLSTPDPYQEQAIEELRQLLLRASLYTLVTHLEDLRGLEDHERLAMAEDCAQEALMAVMARLDEFRGESKFTTWAYKFGVNIALTRARHERWKQVSLDDISEEGDALDWLNRVDALRGASAERPALQHEAWTAIREVVRTQLTPRQRQVLKWIAFDGIPMDVIVQRLDSNRNAIYKMLHDARLKVKRHLAAHGYALEDVSELFE